MTAKRVVVTGLGTTSPVGGDVATTWDALLDGRSGVRCAHPRLGRAARRPDRGRGRGRADRGPRAGQGPPPRPLRPVRPGRRHRGLGRRRAGRRRGRPGAARRRDGLRASAASDAAGQLRHAEGEGAAPGLPARGPDADAQRPGRQHQPRVGARAAVHTPVSACASGNEAIALGIDLIRLGRADVVVVGGTEAAIHPLPMAAFANMMALSKRNDDPEAASASVGHRPRRLRARRGRGRAGARVRGARRGPRREDLRRGAGAGITADSHDIAQPDPAGRGATRAIKLAPARGRHRRRRRRPRQRPRHLDPAGRHRRGLMLHAALGDARRRRGGHQHQVDDRPPARRRRRARVDRHGPRAPPPRRPADDQPRRPEDTELDIATKTRDLPRATSPRSTTPSASAAPTSPSPSGASDEPPTAAPAAPARRQAEAAARPGPAQPGPPADGAARRGHARADHPRRRLRHARRGRHGRRHPRGRLLLRRHRHGRRDGRPGLPGRGRRLPPRDDRRGPDHRPLALRAAPGWPRACCRCTRSAGSSR